MHYIIEVFPTKDWLDTKKRSRTSVGLSTLILRTPMLSSIEAAVTTVLGSSTSPSATTAWRSSSTSGLATRTWTSRQPIKMMMTTWISKYSKEQRTRHCRRVLGLRKRRLSQSKEQLKMTSM